MPVTVWRAKIRVALMVGLSPAAVATGCGRDGAGPQTIEPVADAEPLAELALEEVGGFNEPVALTGDDHGRLYVGERAGIVKQINPGSGQVPQVVIDISADVSTEGEGSLLSLAASPQSAEIFVTYSGRDKQLHLEAITPGRPNAEPVRREILTIEHPNDVHWGGHIDFDDKGRLYLSVGEGGPIAPRPLVSQDPDSQLGKLFRLDPDEEDPSLEMIALGLRNPWQFSVDGTDIWIGDVGDFIQEEVNLASTDAGAPVNYGWPILEGTERTGVEDNGEPLAAPALTYERTGKPTDPYCAITGGHIIRDPELEPLVGRYLFADFCQGDIMAAKPKPKGLGVAEHTGLNQPRIASFAQDAEGHSYVIVLEGPVYRLAFE